MYESANQVIIDLDNGVSRVCLHDLFKTNADGVNWTRMDIILVNLNPNNNLTFP